MFHVQVEIRRYVTSPTLESLNRPFMRLWFYAAFIQIEFGSRKKEVSEVLIHLSQ